MEQKDSSQISIIVGHPFGDVKVSLTEWIEAGPGPRQFVRPVKAILEETGKELPLSVIPLKYRNNRWSRFLIRVGLLENLWK